MSLHLTECLYCGTNLLNPRPEFQEKTTSVPVSTQDWQQALDHTTLPPETVSSKRELIALLLLLPGAVFCLFALLLLFYSDQGTLTLHWNQKLAYFYFLGALPLIVLGWRMSRS